MFKDYLKTERPEIVKNGLVMWLDGKDFTNIPPTSSLRDRSGKGNNATPNGFAYTNLSGSDDNGGIAFDGVNDYINCGNNISLQITGEISLECFVKFTNNTSGTLGLISKYNTTNNTRSYMLGLVNGCARLYASNNGINYDTCDSNPINDGKYHHIVVVFKTSAYLKIYVDGILINTTNTIISSLYNTPSALILGKYDGSSWSFDNKMKFARIYNRALTGEEILQNYIASR